METNGIILNPELKQECDYGCEEGACITAPECSQDTDCTSDFYSDKYCSGDDVYKDYHDFSCVSGECKEEITKELVKECDNGCKNGQCKSDNNEEDSWCIETNSCELTYDDETEFDDSITLKSNNISNLGSILLNNDSKTTAKQPISWFWVIVLAIAIIIVLILVFFLLV